MLWVQTVRNGWLHGLPNYDKLSPFEPRWVALRVCRLA